MAKKVLALVLSLVFVVAMFAGCASGTSTETQKPAGETQAATQKPAVPEGMVDTSKYKKDGKVTIGVSWEGPLNDYSKSIQYHIQYQLEEHYKDKVEKVIFAPADGDPNKQINTVEDLLTKDIDLLLYQPISESAGVGVVEKAMSMGIPVVVFGAGLLTEDYVSYVNVDNKGIGYAFTDWVCQQIGGKGKVIEMLGEAGSGYTEDCLKGINEALKKYPDVQVLPAAYGEYSQAKAKQQMETLLNANPDIKGALVQGGHMGLGIMEACLDKGIEPPFMSVDDINLFQKGATKNNFTKYITYAGGSEVSYDACETAMKILNGEPVKKQNIVPVELFTAQQVKDRIPEGMPDGFWSLTKIPRESITNYYKPEK